MTPLDAAWTTGLNAPTAAPSSACPYPEDSPEAAVYFAARQFALLPLLNEIAPLERRVRKGIATEEERARYEVLDAQCPDMLDVDRPAWSVLEGRQRRIVEALAKERDEARAAIERTDRLIASVIASAHLTATRVKPLWVCVRDLFCVGSTTAQALCETHGYDPDQSVTLHVRAVKRTSYAHNPPPTK